MSTLSVLKFMLAATLACAVATAASAGTYEEGIAAHEHGDFDKAFKIMSELAEQGDVAAQFNVGLSYANGSGVARDDKTAVEWFSRSASVDYSLAEVLLGVMYANGRGVPENQQTAFSWFTLAALHGNPNAQFALANDYLKGIGVEKDEKRAIEWLRRAANQGFPNAQVNLGAAYADGKGVEQNLVDAYFWLTVAAKHLPKGRPRDMTYGLRDEISKKMSDADRAAADKKTEEFKPAPDPDAKPDGTLSVDIPASPVK